MKTEYWTKRMLYEFVDALRTSLGITLSPSNFPLSAISIGKEHCKNLTIEKIPFPTPYICGILYKGDNSTSIALNANRDDCMQNFDCMHELIHYFFHDISYCQLMCSEKKISQDSYIEWQANEGAAQFLVPYQVFIPKYLKLERKYAHSFWEDDSIEDLAKYFNVSSRVIKNRINSLEAEIAQYKRNQQINSLMIISKTKAISLGFSSFKIKQLYCNKCLSMVSNEYNYCPICGNDLINHTFLKPKKRKGAGFMIYKDIVKLDENKKAKICPRCRNEEILEGSYCKICGLELFNRCSNFDETNWNNENSCGEICDANARYCHICGSQTNYYSLNIIPEYTSETTKNTFDIITTKDDDLPF